MALVEIIDVLATNQDGGRFYGFSLDAPTLGVIDGDTILLDGWVIGREDRAVAVEVRDDAQVVVRVPVERPRPDVADVHSGGLGAGQSGYRAWVPVEGLAPAFELQVWAVLADGHEAPLATICGRRRSDQAAASPGAGDERAPGSVGTSGESLQPTVGPWPRVACDEPSDGDVATPDLMVDGWAFSPVGIKEVSVWLDGQELGAAAYGSERPDVAADHPEWPAAPRSGFRFRLGPLPASPSPRTAELQIVADDWLGRRSLVRRRVRLGEAAPLPMAGSIDIPKAHGRDYPFREAGWSNPLVVYGWAVDPDGVEQIDVLVDDQVVAVAELGLPREDIEFLRPEYRALGIAAGSGWLAVLPTEGFGPGRHALRAVVHGRSGTLDLGLTPFWLQDTCLEADLDRQRRVAATLRCPRCRGSLGWQGTDLVCTACEQPIRASEFHTFLCEETYADVDWRGAVATSHGYPPEAAAIIERCRDGLVLDVGAGLRENLPHVIQLDAIAYPTTDVAANAEAMPFPDETFDGVVACNLLEHVTLPVDVVREIRRVCKVGGPIYVDFTSVHPYHGFPHHYFNATETGLEWLMREAGGAVGTVGVEDPRTTVLLVLETWLGSLSDPRSRDLAEEMPVGELLALLRDPSRSAARSRALANVVPNGRRLIPPKVTFAGVRMR